MVLATSDSPLQARSLPAAGSCRNSSHRRSDLTILATPARCSSSKGGARSHPRLQPVPTSRRWRGTRPSTYGKKTTTTFDTSFKGLYDAFFGLLGRGFAAPYHATRAVCHALRSARSHRMLIWRLQSDGVSGAPLCLCLRLCCACAVTHWRLQSAGVSDSRLQAGLAVTVL